MFGPKPLNERKNWFDAETYCRALGGHLSSFDSSAGAVNVASVQLQLSAQL